MNTKEILVGARERIAHRWKKGALYDPIDGGVCAMGALSMAAYEKAGYVEQFDNCEFGEAVNVLASVLPDSALIENANPIQLQEQQSRVVSYNDSTNQQCVLAAFDAAIAKLEAT